MFAAAHLRDQSKAMIFFVENCNWICCNVGCHVFRNSAKFI